MSEPTREEYVTDELSGLYWDAYYKDGIFVKEFSFDGVRHSAAAGPRDVLEDLQAQAEEKGKLAPGQHLLSVLTVVDMVHIAIPGPPADTREEAVRGAIDAYKKFKAQRAEPVEDRPLATWDDPLSSHPRLVWWTRLDGHYQIEVGHQREDRSGMFYVFDHANDDAVVAGPTPVSLSFGAVFGPDVDDVKTWKEMALAVVDSLV